jgi:hypothetical protein
MDLASTCAAGPRAQVSDDKRTDSTRSYTFLGKPATGATNGARGQWTRLPGAGCASASRQDPVNHAAPTARPLTTICLDARLRKPKPPLGLTRSMGRSHKFRTDSG